MNKAGRRVPPRSTPYSVFIGSLMCFIYFFYCKNLICKIIFYEVTCYTLIPVFLILLSNFLWFTASKVFWRSKNISVDFPLPSLTSHIQFKIQQISHRRLRASVSFKAILYVVDYFIQCKEFSQSFV